MIAEVVPAYQPDSQSLLARAACGSFAMAFIAVLKSLTMPA